MSNVEVELPVEQQPPFAMRLTWIEKNCEHDIDKKIFRYVINSRDALRMARVIREAVSLVMELKKDSDMLWDLSMEKFGNDYKISSDIMEVINDS